MQYIKAKLFVRTKEVRDDGSIVEIVIRALPEPLPPGEHVFKCRLYFGWPDRALVRYDNERGKGDHKHLNGVETPYFSVSVEQLLDDFERDITRRGEHEGNR